MCGVTFIQDEDASGGDQDQEERRWNKRTQQMLHGLQVCHRGLGVYCKGSWGYSSKTVVMCHRTRKPVFVRHFPELLILKFFNTLTVRPRVSLEGIQVSALPWLILQSRFVVMYGALLCICVLFSVEQIYVLESLHSLHCCSVRCHLPSALKYQIIDEIS